MEPRTAAQLAAALLAAPRFVLGEEQGAFEIDTHALTAPQLQILELVEICADMASKITDASGDTWTRQGKSHLCFALRALANSGAIIADEGGCYSVA